MDYTNKKEVIVIDKAEEREVYFPYLLVSHFLLYYF